MTEPLAMFKERAEVCALLWQTQQFTLHEGVDRLQLAAEACGLIESIGQDAVQEIIASAFTAVSEPAEPIYCDPPPHNDAAAKSTLDAAAWLWFQVGDERRFDEWINSRGRSASERGAIMRHIDQIEARRNAKNGG